MLMVYYVLFLCIDLGWWGKEMGEEVIYILSKLSFFIFSFCYCLESIVFVYGSLVCVFLGLF